MFDDSLPTLLGAAIEVLGGLERLTVLREPAGRLSVLYDGYLETTTRERLADLLDQRLGKYARRDFLVADRSDDLAASLFDESRRQWIHFGNDTVPIIDRRIVGGDWLGQPAGESFPPRFVFSSFKGGVGRSTALSCAARDLARSGRNVLVVDLDLEAPGIGTLLLDEESLPRLGMIDYLTEILLSDGMGPAVDELVSVNIGSSRSGGRLEVLPAFGRSSLQRPEDFMSKLARAMLDVGPDGTPLPVGEKIRRCLDRITAEREYDVVLIDSRAGLAELSAGPILHLGATILLFGNAHQQTIDGIRFLFAHLATLTDPGKGSLWDNLRVVQAKTASKEKQRWFREEMHALFQKYLYEELAGEVLLGFNFDVDDPDSPHFPIPIPLNPVFADWSPRDSDIADETFESTFGSFIKALRQLLADKNHGKG